MTLLALGQITKIIYKIILTQGTLIIFSSEISTESPGLHQLS